MTYTSLETASLPKSSHMPNHQSLICVPTTRTNDAQGRGSDLAIAALSELDHPRQDTRVQYQLGTFLVPAVANKRRAVERLPQNLDILWRGSGGGGQ
jgi:hypothetical protein